MDFKKIDSMLYPFFLKYKILDDIGIDYIIGNYDSIRCELHNHLGDYVIRLLYFGRKKLLLDRIANYDLNSSSDFNSFNAIINYSTVKGITKDIILSIKIDNIIKLIVSNECSSSVNDLIYRYRKDEINNYLDIDISTNSIDKYFTYSICSGIKKYIVNNMDINTIVSLYLNKSTDYKIRNAIEQERYKDIIDYILLDISNDIDKLKSYLYKDLSKDMYKVLLDSITLNNNLLEEIFNNIGSSCKEVIIKEYSSIFYAFLDDKIDDNTYFDYIKYTYNEDVYKYVVIRLNDIQINELLHKSYLESNFSKLLYSIRENDIVNIIVSDIENDINHIKDYGDVFKDDNIATKVIKSINLDKNVIENILSKGGSSLVGILYKFKKDIIIEILDDSKKKDKRTFFIHYLSYGYSNDIYNYIINNLSDNDILEIYNMNVINYEYKDKIWKVFKDRIVSLFKDLLSTKPELAKSIFANCGACEIRSYLIDNLDFNILYDYISYFTSSESNKFVNRYRYLIRDELIKDYNNDKINFFFDKVGYGDSDLSNIAFSLFNDKDLIDVIRSCRYCYVLDRKDYIKDRFKDAIINESKNIINGDWNKCVLFLKGLREYLDDLFELFLDNIEYDDEIINNLFIERGLSDKQKEIFYNRNRIKILEIVNERILLDEDYAITYIQKGTPSEVLGIVLEHVSKDKLIELLNDDNFVNRKSVGKKFAGRLCYLTYSNKDNVDIVKSLLTGYKKDSFKFIKYFEDIERMLIYLGIDSKSFWQYSLNVSYDFIDDLINIYNNDLDVFKIVREKLMNILYPNSSMYSYMEFLSIVKNFNRYRDLCLDIISKDNLDDKDRDNLLLLFNQSNTLEDKPIKISDCINVIDMIRNEYINLFNNCKEIDDYKNLLSLMLFNNSYSSLKDILHNYGNVSNLLELKYYNRYNKDVLDKIDSIILYTCMIEDIIDSNDIDSLRCVCLSTINYIEDIIYDFNMSEYEDLMRELYGLELDSNLTKINDISSYDSVYDEDRSNKYGVTVYDFSDKEYCILAHVISNSENYDDLINGISNGKMNFISLSAISHRMQAYYYGAVNMIFGYDTIDVNNYLCSSVDNMGTNRKVKNNSSEVDSIKRIQRGILEVSDSSGNSEVLAIREGLKPKYIIIPGDREPTNEEIDVAKKYNLIICYTQKKNFGIENPIKIEHDNDKLNEIIFNRKILEDTRMDLINRNGGIGRKVAILTDIHGLLEPTITILEDIRRKGISEIYSLGDNVGTGPNPKEVLDLLDIYGVRSIKGNHEEYIIHGVDYYKEHLIKTNAYDVEKEEALWTSNHLSTEQLNTISSYEDSIELFIGGKRILLCHYLVDYNTEVSKYNLDDYDLVIMGHKHFKDIKDKVITLKGAGIGNKNVNDIGIASYMIITELENDIKIEYVNIPYNYKNTLNDINVSDSHSKSKMKVWVGRK